ncbi:MAG: hypothetical protein LDL51_09330 [Chloroflexi bacterium]|nr:hypothetical protein [Chloroflexota bacterium]
MKNFRDIELLSLYLDGQLSSFESARLEARLSSDPELNSILNDLRVARGMLRQLPPRKAPRNFTLTRQMVGLKPPLPRSYSFFRFSSAFAAVLLMLTFAANALSGVPLIGNYAGGFGMGGGGGGVVAESAPMLAAEAPAAMDETSPDSLQTPTPTMAALAPAPEMEAAPTQTADSAATEVPAAKQMEAPPEAFAQPPVENRAGAESTAEDLAQRQPPIPVIWQVALFFAILFSGLTAFLLRRAAIQKWK